MCIVRSIKKFASLLLLAKIMIPMDIVPRPPPSSRPPATPPNSPHLRTCKQVYTSNTGQFQEPSKAIQDDRKQNRESRLVFDPAVRYCWLQDVYLEFGGGERRLLPLPNFIDPSSSCMKQLVADREATVQELL